VIVIPRQRGESVIIGDDVVITVFDIRGDKVRLAVELPKNMSLHRKEVYDAIVSRLGQPVPREPD
jgi:carbon storage regulator